MKMQRLAIVFGAGCLGALLNSLAVWVFGLAHITTGLGVQIAPPLTPAWLYPRIVWGGLWGFLFLIPLLTDRWVWRGLLFSVAPTLVQWLIVFPLKAQKGMLGLELGALTPLFVVLFNAVWGIVASWYVDRAMSEHRTA